MDGESSCESDISESWSLIDINLNEESISVAESCSEVDKSSEFVLNCEKSNKTELEDFVRRCKEINKTDFSGISDSDSDASFKNQGLPNCNVTETDGNDCLFKRSSDSDGKHDSADAESIEILDADDSETGKLDASNFHQFDFPTYQSDDEESLEGNIDNENRSINSAVIKRRRRRVNKGSEEIVHSVNSESISSSVDNSTPSSIDTKKVNQKLGEESKKANSHPVYKHYRNNVANTILSLSVGIIFAGVACMAIGHFLGVQNASENAGELVETLKKLQVENAALQSRLLHLNRALLTREANSEIEMPLNEPQSTVSCEQTQGVDDSKNEANLNNAALYEIRSSLNSIEWLSKLEDYVRKNNRVTDTEYRIDFKGFRKFIHDELYTLNGNQDDGAKILKETDKISKVLQKVINRLSSSQDHIEKLYERLIKFKNKLNHKVKRIFPESSKESQSERSKFQGKVPVTELDLQIMNSDQKKDIHKDSDPLYSESVVLYKFPQPENYYQKEKHSVDNTDKKVKTNSKKDVKNKDFEKAEKIESQNRKKYKKANEKKEKSHSKDNWKKNRSNEKKIKEKKGGKRRKRNANKLYNFEKNVEKDQKNNERIDNNESKHKKVPDNQNVFNETIHQNKKYSKTGDKAAFSKHILKKYKNSKLRKILLSKVRRRLHFQGKPYNTGCPGPECFNVTGYWIFKWAGGREEIRRHQTLGDWQFSRAKMRKELREDENEERYLENWQFKRAEAREHNRNFCRNHGKCSEYNKDFFHEGFSWF